MDNEENIKTLLKEGIVYCKIHSEGPSDKVYVKLKLIKHISPSIYIARFSFEPNETIYRISLEDKYFIPFKTEEKAKRVLTLIIKAWTSL